MTGSLEVTVWPETWEQTRDLWQPGNIVVVNVRVKARDDRLQLSVQKASLYGDPSFDLNDLLSGQRRLERQRLSPQRQRERGNGNGGYRAKSSAPPVTPPARPSALSIILEETDDEDGDHERLRALIATVGDYSGEAAARLAIRQRDGKKS